MAETPALPPGLTVLVVEDEPIIAMMLEDILTDLGFAEVRVAHDVKSGLSEAEARTPDLAILDLNVAGIAVYPVAEALKARGVKTIFASGYGAGGLDAAWQSHVVIAKPYSDRDVAVAVAKALAES